jgi:hypothetical protein
MYLSYKDTHCAGGKAQNFHALQQVVVVVVVVVVQFTATFTVMLF